MAERDEELADTNIIMLPLTPNIQIPFKLRESEDALDESAEKLIKMCKTGKNAFLCLTTQRLLWITVERDGDKFEPQIIFDLENDWIVSAHSEGKFFRNYLVILNKYDNENTIKKHEIPVDNPDEWIKEVNFIIKLQGKYKS